MSKTRTLVATGASSGLGFEAVRQLLTDVSEDTAYTAILGCRDVDATKRAYNAADLPIRHELRCFPLELSRLQSVKEFAHEILSSLGELHIDTLLLCAAISKGATEQDQKDGKWSHALIVNYAAQQYLLFLLQEKLKESKSRIIVVTSMLYKKVQDLDQLGELVSSSSTASALEIYRSTKFIQLASLQRWKERLSGSCNIVAVSPGFVPTTGLSRETGYVASLLMKYILPWAPFATSLYDGGQAIKHALSESRDLSAEKGVDHILTKAGEWERLNGMVTEASVVERWWLSQQDLEAMRASQGDMASG